MKTHIKINGGKNMLFIDFIWLLIQKHGRSRSDSCKDLQTSLIDPLPLHHPLPIYIRILIEVL